MLSEHVIMKTSSNYWTVFSTQANWSNHCINKPSLIFGILKLTLV